MAPLLPSQADSVVRELTNGRLRIEFDAAGVYLVHEATCDKLHLLPYQLTPQGLEQAVAEFWEPQPEPGARD